MSDIPVELKARRFALDDVVGLVDFLVEKFRLTRGIPQADSAKETNATTAGADSAKVANATTAESAIHNPI